jgi:tagaturonate reductase
LSRLHETVLQFGGGNFLRAFADLFLHESNMADEHPGRAVVVQSTRSGRADAINAQRGRYHVVVRGILAGCPVDETTEVTSVSRAIEARQNWQGVLEVGRSAQLRMIVSNTTEAGYRLVEGDPDDSGAPESFPAKLLAVLRARFEADLPGLAVLPCELLEPNGELLRDLVTQQAHAWNLDRRLIDWLHSEVRWANTLVDRIVSGRPDAHPLLDRDALLTVSEPYALWVVQDQGRVPFPHPAIVSAADVRPYALRKVRILNGAHTSLVCRAQETPIETVREAVADPEVGPWLRDLVFEEIVPTVEGEVDDPAGFAANVLERFANPHLNHRLSDIALHHEEKVRVRLIPTYESYLEKFGKPPKRLATILEPYL